MNEIRVTSPNALLRRLGYVRWGPPEFPLPADLAGRDGIVHEPARHEVLAAIASPEPETILGDRDNDRLATELFRRYGSVERGLFRARDHWEADATAVRQILVAEQLVTATAHSGAPDPETEAAIWNDGSDEAWRQRDDELIEDLIVGLALAAAACAVTFAAGWLVGRAGRP